MESKLFLTPQDELYNYVMYTPYNTNPNVLRGLIDSIDSSDISDKTEFKVNCVNNTDAIIDIYIYPSMGDGEIGYNASQRAISVNTSEIRPILQSSNPNRLAVSFVAKVVCRYFSYAENIKATGGIQIQKIGAIKGVGNQHYAYFEINAYNNDTIIFADSDSEQ